MLPDAYFLCMVDIFQLLPNMHNVLPDIPPSDAKIHTVVVLIVIDAILAS